MLSHEIRRSAISLCYPLFSHAFATWCPLYFLNIDYRYHPQGLKMIALYPPLSFEIFSGNINKDDKANLLTWDPEWNLPCLNPVYRTKQDIILPRIGVFSSKHDVSTPRLHVTGEYRNIIGPNDPWKFLPAVFFSWGKNAALGGWVGILKNSHEL